MSSDQAPGLRGSGPGSPSPGSDRPLPLCDPQQERGDQGAAPGDDEDQERGQEHQHLQRGQC